MKASFSDEMINAFLDNELDLDERNQLLNAIEEDESLGVRICELQKGREMLRLAYHPSLLPDTQISQERQHRPRWYQGVAAALLLSLGTLAGWLSHQQLGEPTLTEIAKVNELNKNEQSEALQFLLHLTSAEPHKTAILLDEAEKLLAQKLNQNTKVSILANGKGMALLRSENSTTAQRIKTLKQRYPNISFLACQQTLNRLAKQMGKPVAIVPEAEVVPSALSEIIKRRQAGWSYLQI